MSGVLPANFLHDLPSSWFQMIAHTTVLTSAQAAPKTGFHTAPEQLMREALQHFYEDADSLVIKPTVGDSNSNACPNTSRGWD
jgi:hypothetical protein